jgi:hypothetical protein
MPIDAELEQAWAALQADPDRPQGLRTFPITISGTGRVRAACAFPGGEEAILVDLSGIQWPQPLELPRGDGFVVSRLPDSEGVGLVLVRRPTANVALFTLMAADVVRGLEPLGGVAPARRLRWVVERVRAWQAFMSRGADPRLGPEAERGLIGELAWLGRMLDAGVAPPLAVGAWRAPERGLHDFDHAPLGAIEVKSAVGGPGFPVTVTSLEQLDADRRQPLALVGVRLRPDPGALTLPEQAAALLGRLAADDPTAAALAANRLVQVGLLPGTEGAYIARYAIGEVLLVPVVAQFPALTPASVPATVVGAQYVLNLDALRDRSVDPQAYLISNGWVADGRA